MEAIQCCVERAQGLNKLLGGVGCVELDDGSKFELVEKSW